MHYRELKSGTLKECPFCGSEVDKAMCLAFNEDYVQIRCSTCCAYGSPEHNESDAVNSWNERHLLPKVPKKELKTK